MKSSRFKTAYRASASSLHRTVGDLLKSIPALSGHKLYQEYPVSRVNPSVRNNRLKYDWVDLDLKLVWEIHGKQHFSPGFIIDKTDIQAEEDFKKQQARDRAKKLAAIKAGWGYISIRYDEIQRLTPEILLAKIQSVERISPVIQQIVENSSGLIDRKQKQREQRQRARELFRQSENYQLQKEKQKEYRKLAYQRAKERRNGQSSRSVTSSSN